MSFSTSPSSPGGSESVPVPRTAAGPRIRERWLWSVLGFAVWILACVPLLLVHVAPYADLPSHLARYEILTRIGSDPHYSAYWQSAWAPLPNLGVDFLVLGFARFLPVLLASKIVTVLIVGTVGYGFMRLYEAWGGERSPYSLLGYGLVYGFPLTMGFLNYVMGTGLLLLSVALHLRLREGSVGAYLVRMVPLTFAMALTHMISFAQAMLVIGVLELAAMRTGMPLGTGGGPARTRDVVVRTMPLFILPILLLVLGPKGELDVPFYGAEGWAELYEKYRWFTSAFRTGSMLTDQVYMIVLLVSAVLLWRLGHRWTRPAQWTILALFLVFLVSPFSLRTMHLDSRQPWVLAIIALALLAPQAVKATDHKKRLAVFAVLGMFFLFRVGVVTKAHVRRSHEIDEVTRVFAGLPEGSLLLTTYGEDSANWDMNTWEPPLMHLGSLAIFVTRVYPNTIFTVKGQQPLQVRPEFTRLQTLQYYRELSYPKRGILNLQRKRALLPDAWRTKSAFVFFVGGPEGAKRGPGAELIAHSGRWGLYQLPPVARATGIGDMPLPDVDRRPERDVR